MNIIVISIFLWLGRLIVTFPAITSVTKAASISKDRKLPLPLKIMMIHLILAFFLQAGIDILEFLHINYAFLFHIYIVEEFVLDMLFYRELLKKTHPYKDKLTESFYLLISNKNKLLCFKK